MDCSEALLLVEKLFDGEANARERFDAEAHLVQCDRCRDHKKFLDIVATVARKVNLEDPPESYWNALPRRVIDRIEAETPRRGLVLRGAALAATMVVAIAVGVYVASDGELEPPRPDEALLSDGVGTLAASEGEAAEEPAASREAASPPPMVRDETAPAAEVAGLDRDVEELRLVAPEAPAEAPAEASAEAMEMPVAPQSLLVGEADVGRTSRARQMRDCDGLRDRLRELDGANLTEGRYRLALCSLERYEAEQSPELHEIARRDAESFLAVETDSLRASRLREALTRIQ